MAKPYWCFICQKEFASDVKQMSQCPFCHEQAFEQITIDNHPQQYEVYQRTVTHAQPVQHQQTSQLQNQNIQIRISSSSNTANDFNFVFSGILNSIPRIGQSLRILNLLMRNLQQSGQRYRRATQAEIQALQKIDKASQCSICQLQEIQAHNQSYRLRCGHQFHILCIQPWFEKANTCPTCRTKLTNDD